MAKGKKTGGRVAGTPNKTTSKFKEILNNLLEDNAPQMIEWLNRVAQDDPNKALDQMGKLAEYVHPKLARTEHAGKIDTSIIIEVHDSAKDV